MKYIPNITIIWLVLWKIAKKLREYTPDDCTLNGQSQKNVVKCLR